MSEKEKMECLQLQLTEVEMLSSMYPSSGEFCVSLPAILADMNAFVSGKSEILPNRLDFTLNLEIPDIKEKLEVNINLPHEYPNQKPEVSARSSGLNRCQHQELNSSLRDYVRSIPDGDLCTLSLVTWLTENASRFFQVQTEPVESSKDNSSSGTSRFWIYSHHIYNKFKRREIVDTAQELHLTGFSLPGKPGFICIEGLKSDCDRFMQCLKQMSWKKISLVKEEDCYSRKFEEFREISFEARRGPAREYHMDMGQFLKYLEEHNCGYAFQDFFGIEGHSEKKSA